MNNPQSMTWANWSRDVIDHLIDMLEIPNGDAQALFESTPVVTLQCWKANHTPEQAARAIDEQSRTIETWSTFTRRTNRPKLDWLMARLKGAGIERRLVGDSAHAPILEVRTADLDRAWAFLPVEIDEMPDDHPMFTEHD